MKTEVFPSGDAAAARAAELIARHARSAIAARGRFVLALSGGGTPARMFDALTDHDIAWPSVHVFQVDERVAPRGHAERNFSQLCSRLLNKVAIPFEHIHPMPVQDADLDEAATRYAAALAAIAGVPAVLDTIHLGIGSDGHTASLIPGDPVLEVLDRDVAITGPYQGRKRMTLTYPAINRARDIVWLVASESKANALARLRAADPSIPAGRIAQQQACLIADAAAAGG
jgi:6-phosphogluconolactonase